MSVITQVAWSCCHVHCRLKRWRVKPRTAVVVRKARVIERPRAPHPPPASPRRPPGNLQCSALAPTPRCLPPPAAYDTMGFSLMFRRGRDGYRANAPVESFFSVREIFSPGNSNAPRDCDKKWTAGNVNTLPRARRREPASAPRRPSCGQHLSIYVFYTTLYFESVWKRDGGFVYVYVRRIYACSIMYVCASRLAEAPLVYHNQVKRVRNYIRH